MLSYRMISLSKIAVTITIDAIPPSLIRSEEKISCKYSSTARAKKENVCAL